MAEHAVIVHFKYAAASLDSLHDLEQRLKVAITGAGVGEYDGHEVAVDLSHGALYMYGPDAEALFAVVRPLLGSADCFRTARVVMRYGPPEVGVPERVIMLGAEPGSAPGP